MNIGLIGKYLVHSFSPNYFTEKFTILGLKEHSYKAFELAEMSETALNELILEEKLNGFNITIPYKESILLVLNELSADAAIIGAVNTVAVKWEDNNSYTLKGYNTDWTGFLKAIRPFLTLHHQKALILGTGGASKAIAYALKSLGIDYYFVSRTKNLEHSNCFLYSELNEFVMKHFKLIINTTPLGTFPEIENTPAIPYHFIGHEHLLCDLVYNPAETQFMKLGKANGAAVINGLGMLQFQADEAWAIWNK